MRWIFSTAGFAVIICFSTIAASPTQAAVLSVGARSGSFVNQSVCMDVEGNNPAPGTPVIAFQCHAGPNQQFQLAFTGPPGSNGQIFVEAPGFVGCLDAGNMQNGTQLVFVAESASSCAAVSNNSQQWQIK
jgi:hypothetical protein